MEKIETLLRASERDCDLIQKGQVACWQNFSNKYGGTVTESSHSYVSSSLFPGITQLGFNYSITFSDLAGTSLQRLTAGEDGIDILMACGELWTLFKMHLKATRSCAKLNAVLPGDELDEDIMNFDLFLLFLSHGLATDFFPSVDLFTIFPYGSIFSIGIPAHRPFVFLQCFDTFNWILIAFTIAVLGIHLAERHLTRAGHLIIDMFGLFLNQPLSSVTFETLFKRSARTRWLIVLWLAIVTVLSACMSGTMRELMVSSHDPYVVKELSDLLAPPFDHHQLIVRDIFKINVDYFKTHDGGHLEGVLIAEDRLYMASLTEEDPLTNPCLRAMRTQFDVVFESMIAQLWMFFNSARRTLMGDPLYKDWDSKVWAHLQRLHVTPPVGVDMATMPFGVDTSEEIRRTYRRIFSIYTQEGFIDLAMEEKPNLILSQILPVADRSYEQLQLKDFLGPFIIYFGQTVLSFVALHIEVLTYRLSNQTARKRKKSKVKPVINSKLIVSSVVSAANAPVRITGNFFAVDDL